MYPGHELTAPLPSSVPSHAAHQVLRPLKVFLSFLMLMRVFGSLIKTPISQFYFTYIGIPLFFIEQTFAAWFILDRLLVKQGRFNRFDLIIIGVFLFMILQGGLATYFFYGQPIIKGMLQYKYWGLIWDSIIIMYLLRIRFLDISHLRDALLFGAWLQLPVFVVLIFVLNPSQFAGTLFVYCNEAKGGCQFEFDIFFFLFASIYYFIRLLQTNRLKYGLFFLLFFGYVFFVNQKRGVSMSLLATVGLFALFHLTRDKLIYYAMLSVLVLVAMAGMIKLFFPEVLERIIVQYTNAFEALSGQRTGEASADARLRESLIALKYLDRYPLSWLFGNGKLDLDWERTPVDFYHFYPSDLGLFGVIFQYGILGLFVGLMGFYGFVLFNHRRIHLFRENSFYLAIVYFLLFLFIRGLPTGGSFFDPGIATTSTFVGLHYFFYLMQKYPDRFPHSSIVR